MQRVTVNLVRLRGTWAMNAALWKDGLCQISSDGRNECRIGTPENRRTYLPGHAKMPPKTTPARHIWVHSMNEIKRTFAFIGDVFIALQFTAYSCFNEREMET
jgi:hypothetical protein